MKIFKLLQQRVFLVIIVLYVLYFSFYVKTVLSYFEDVPGYGLKFEPGYIYVFFTIFLGIFCGSLLPRFIDKPSNLLITLIYLFNFLPSILSSIYILNIKDAVLGDILITLEFLFILVSLLFIKKINFKLISFKIFNIKHILYLLLILIFFFDFIIIKIFGFKWQAPNITDVYGVRSLFKEQLSKMNPIISYLILNFSFYVNPFALLVAIKNIRKTLLSYLVIVLSFFSSYLIYANSGLKSVAFVNFVALFIYFYFKNFKRIETFFLSIIFLFVITNLLINFSEIAKFVYYHLIRRMFLTPGMNVNYYYEYFVENGIFYTRELPAIISWIHYGTDGSANNGILGDSFAKLYPVGFFLNTMLVLLVVKTLDSFAKFDKKIFLSMTAIYAYLFSNSAVTTVLVSYGLIIFICIVSIISWRNNK